MSQHLQTRGVLSMLGAALCFAAMATIIRSAPHIDAYRMSFFRFAVGLAVLGSLVLGGRIELSGRRPLLLFARGAFGAVAVLLFYLSINWIGVAKGTALSYTYPVFAAVFGAWFLRERVSLPRAALILAACVGIGLITSDGGSFGVFSRHDLLALVGAACAGVAIVVVRKLREDHSPFVIYLSQCGVGFWVMLLPANLKPSDIGISGGLVLLAIGLTATGGQLMMTYAYRHLTVVGGSLLAMLTPVLTTLIGLVFFREAVGLRGGLGIALVIACCMALSVRPRRPAGPGKPGDPCPEETAGP